jgi:hypothetical protein
MSVPVSEFSPVTSWPEAMEFAIGLGRQLGAVDKATALDLHAKIGRWEAQMAGIKLGLIRIIDEGEVAKESGQTSTSSLLSNNCGGDQAASSRQVRTAQNLKVATLTEKALEAGEISFEKAEVIARTMAGLPESLDELTRIRVEKRLIGDAKRLSLPDLRRRVMRVADIYRPRDEADLDEDTRLRRQEARAWQHTEFWIGAVRDGKARIGGEIPALYADLLKNQLGAIAAPRRNGLEGRSAATSTIDPADELSYGQRMGRAFCHWIEKIPTDGLPTTGGTPATLTVNIDYDTLADKVRQAAGTLATGERISASEVRRLACTHQILPRVLDGKSQVLDQGRSKRVFTPAQRLAMADRDGGCTYPGCDRPPAWTEAHHIDWWAKHGGATDPERGTLLCAQHHHWVHAEDIHIRRRDGHTEFRLNGIWQTNRRWRP